MAKLRSRPPAASGANCPQESEWPKVAAELTQGSEAEALLLHAAACDHCGPLLRQSLADFAEDLTTEEEATLDGLESSRQDWQRRMAAKLSRSGHRPGILARLRRHLPGGHPVMAWAYTAGVAVMVAAGVLIVNQERPIENLLATAYTEQRTIELRIPDAAYAPVRVVRGSTGRSRLDRPPVLLEGEARIARELAKHPNDPRWLQARGRADLLDRNYESAIASFQRALTLQPDSPTLVTDLASAHFERAETNHSQTDYSAAIELLNRALKIAPDDPVALFNRAIVYDRMHLYDAAIQDWQHYLRADPGSTWTPEARQRLADAELAKNKKH